jgi:hypothetical protein
VNDLAWCGSEDWYMASVAEDNVLQVWQPAASSVLDDEDEDEGEGGGGGGGGGGEPEPKKRKTAQLQDADLE